MKLDVTFAENAATFAADFAESNESLTADFGELHVVSGGGTDGKDGAGGSGGDCAAIIDVVALPETDIREDVFYRMVTAEFHWGGEQWGPADCIAVDTLPEIGEPVTDADMTRLTFYYAVDTEESSAYVTDELGAAYGIPAGWYPSEMIITTIGMDYGGIVSDITEIIDTNMVYLLVENSVKYRNSEKWASVQGLGRQGTGASSVIFNSSLNEANGKSGFSIGYNTKANGEASSAEGLGTVAVGSAQHVEGSYNIIDEVEDPYDRQGKYVHIVGNGKNENHRSNIYTLDWSGTAWFSGSVYVGPIGASNRNEHSQKLVANGDSEIILTSPSGTRYRLTVADDGTLTTAAV